MVALLLKMAVATMMVTGLSLKAALGTTTMEAYRLKTSVAKNPI